MLKDKIIQRLYEAGHITFEEVLVLQRDSGVLPSSSTMHTYNAYPPRTKPLTPPKYNIEGETNQNQ